MSNLGYVEGETISYDLQNADNDLEQMKAIAEQFVADNVDLIVTTTTDAAQAAKAATVDAQIPVVFTFVGDPVGSGLVADLRQPGGNVTGITRWWAGSISKRIAFLHEIMPDLKGIWFPYQEGHATAALTLQAIHEVADRRQIAVIETAIGSPTELFTELERLSTLDELGFEAINLALDPILQSKESMTAIMAFANEHKLPVAANTAQQVRNGALLTYAADIVHTGQLAAPLADQILKGTKAGMIPIAYNEPVLFLNYQTAQTLGLAIDESILAQAVEIVR